jgi:hypothetical protein
MERDLMIPRRTEDRETSAAPLLARPGKEKKRNEKVEFFH